MRAIGVRVLGGPDALEVLDLPEPHAGPGELRIRVQAAAVNPTDTLQRSTRRQDVDPPWVPGMDIAGVVDEVGEGGGDLLGVGDPAMAIVVPAGTHGAYAEYVVVPKGSAVALPDGADAVAAATLPMNGLTARLALDELAVPAGGTLAVTGAAGAFGGYVVQLAVAAGIRVVADASDADRDLVRGLGADVVLARGDGFPAAVREVVPDGVDGLADGSVQGDALLPAVRDGGRIATVRGYRGPSGDETAERGITWHPVWVRTIAEHRDKLDELRALASSGAVTLRVAGTYPAERAPDAHRALEAGGQRGRAVLTF
ncbi:NADPH:quinone reductase-like Zn-dependent oxidoreductase [Pseudonocardia sediminis]|uniref:NADPH:quinone reductase-like Zn-dependent oxidoreductase n=1 Tax=Pseudonocardia sediminis TaxID=1397368 RepID=A0A4Q7UZ12_PSEST|nr:NADP-dependent oxidoreductase [Pseudonocardia sediminis]RZT87196.1 NADPH:quinone reductase-like Zn-dependent oxidoreductase [Pseudonocardia sediminis]